MQAVRTRKERSAPEPMAVVHRTPQRCRVRVMALRGNPEMAEAIEYFLPRRHAFRRVAAHWRTGSVIVEGGGMDAISDETLLGWIRSLMRKTPPAMHKRKDATEDEERASGRRIHEALSPAPEALLEAMRVDRSVGLRASELERRRKAHGSNIVSEAQPTDRWELFKKQFNNSQSGLLAGAALLSAFTGGAVEVVMISGVVLLNGYISYISEAHAEDVICSIGKLEPLTVKVLRDRQWISLRDDQLLVGDIVKVRRGAVPADLRLLECTQLSADESSLTGESVPVSKHANALQGGGFADRGNLLFRGSYVTSGEGIGIVFAVGENTEIGRIRRLVEISGEQASPLQKDLDQIHRYALVSSSLVCLGVLTLGLWRGRRLPAMLKSSIALAVAAVPEGLPTIGTTTMALGVSGLKRRNVVVRKLHVLEALGSVDILCLDKTGTLTMNDMIAAEGFFGLSFWSRERLLDSEILHSHRGDYLSARTWGLVAALCTDCEWIPKTKPRQWAGSSTEKALVDLAFAIGMDPVDLWRSYPRINASYRDEYRQYMVTYHKQASNGRIMAAVKGNPEQVLDLCLWIFDQGAVKELVPELKEKIREQNRRLAAKGLRVIGFAYQEGDTLEAVQDASLIWAGIVGLADPMREGAVDLMQRFEKAGIRTIMMTGDQEETALALGQELKMRGQGQVVRSSDASELQEMSLDEIAELTKEVRIFSRVSPAAKLRIVQALQKQGHIVAMTGDGINDSPALKASHVGIAMGFQGTSAARDSADIVLRDDNLRVLYEAIEQGRALRSNMRKSIRYLLATNFSEILLTLHSMLNDRPIPLNPLQILWINLLSDVLPAMALALDPASKTTMCEKPRTLRSSLLPARDRWQLFGEAALLSLGAYAAQGNELEERSGSSGAFVSLTISQILHTLSVSAERGCLLTEPWPKNARLYQTMGLAGFTVALGVVSPRFQHWLGNRTMSKDEWLNALLHGLWPVVLHEVTKLLHPQEPILYSYSSGG